MSEFKPGMTATKSAAKIWAELRVMVAELVKKLVKVVTVSGIGAADVVWLRAVRKTRAGATKRIVIGGFWGFGGDC